MKFEDFPKKCIKCKKSDVELHKFTYASSIGNRTISFSFPVCSLCKPKFERSNKIENAFKTMRYITIISGIITIFMIIALISGFSSAGNNIILFIAAIITIIGLGLYITLMVDVYRIKHFFILKKSGEIIFKNKEYQQEIIDHVVEEELEKAEKLKTGIGTIYCPKCGSQQIRGIDFCNNCGKELRDL
ncbi:MAG: hypothetical protein ACFFA7_12425 [Promethearchaeota archaeon]